VARGVRVSRLGVIAVLLTALAGCDLVRHWWGEQLTLTATTTSLGVGESVRVSVRRKVAWFWSGDLADPSQTRYATTSESALVVEPDGQATCVGTYGRPYESAWVSASNGAAYGHLSIDLRPDGPGPTLELVPVSRDLPVLPDDARSIFVPCCSAPLALREGQRMRFTIQARASGRDLTSSASGTRYTLFFGSGEPNDPHPEVVTGGPAVLSATTFRLDAREGTMTAPASIGRLNRGRVIVFFRNETLVGWREVVIIHR